MSSPVSAMMAQGFVKVINEVASLYGVTAEDVWQAMAIITRDSEQMYRNLCDEEKSNEVQ